MITGSNSLIQVQESSEGDMNMCTALERLEERGREAGRIEGRAEGIREILFALLKAGAEVRLLKEVSGLSEEEIVALRKEIK